MLEVVDYEPDLHGATIGLVRRRRAWDEIFERAAKRPVLVKGASRNSIYHNAYQRGLRVRVEALDGREGFVVSVR